MSVYERYEALSPIYQGGLTNHLPMMLVALEQSGVKKEKIIEILNSYRDKKALFDLTDQASPISDFDQEYINKTGHYLGEINNKGEDIVIGMFLNERRDAIASGLFHGLIRLYYAKLSKNPLQIAQALSYFDLITEKIDIKGKSVPLKKLPVFIDDLLNQYKTQPHQFEERRSMDRFKELLEQDVVKNNLFIPDVIKSEYVLDLILERYLKTKDFYQLHLITGFHALIELQEYIFEFDEVLKHFVLLSEVFILFNLEERDISNKEESLDELLLKIDTLEDAHEIKLLFSLYSLNMLYENEKIVKIANTIL